MPKVETLHYDDGDCRADLRIKRLYSALDFVRFGQFEQQAAEGRFEDDALRTIAMVMWPGAMAASAGKIELRVQSDDDDPLDPEEWMPLLWPVPAHAFADLPQEFVDSWLETVWRLNPEIDPTLPQEQRSEKKASSGSAPE